MEDSRFLYSYILNWCDKWDYTTLGHYLRHHQLNLCTQYLQTLFPERSLKELKQIITEELT